MLVPDFAYGTAVSMRVPFGNSFRPVNRKPPLEMSSQVTTNSRPEKRMQAVIFIPARRFLRRSSIGEATGGGAEELLAGAAWDSFADGMAVAVGVSLRCSIVLGWETGAGDRSGLFLATLAPVSFQAMNELQVSQERVNSLEASKISSSMSVSEIAHTEWQPLQMSCTVLAGSAAGNCKCQILAKVSTKASP